LAKEALTPQVLDGYEQRLFDLLHSIRKLRSKMTESDVPEVRTSLRTFEGALERMEQYFPNFTHAHDVAMSVRSSRRESRPRRERMDESSK
jgi:hypothetical protein